ncbi:hypothetical protein FisN_15Lh142 [Fistulifera solaris]|uniref:Peptidase A1 domain-containing protein n=1 Tax=Fistulifera solaris TaxID=1519565 RepID=A0A1Z5KBG3_FISSO|nr:hypothetical protein FisN_15Lh142 [Fistulifera solaris]|eukprot:GAX23421.1 hypothetical protein FisN_15Lh142 [Fistulifera solaris]
MIRMFLFGAVWLSCCAGLQLHFTRRELGVLSVSSVPPSLFSKQPTSVPFPLQYLPIGNCWALKVSIADNLMNGFTFLAIVDTGSPFLTTPARSLQLTDSTRFPSSYEQYGEPSGKMEWRNANYVTLIAEQNVLFEQRHIVLGVPSNEVVKETGGIFAGLIWKDDNRPSFLQQLGFIAMHIDFGNNHLTLSRQPLLSRNDPASCTLYNLRPFGPDLYHYAVLCDVVELQFIDKDDDTLVQTLSLDRNNVKRPIVAVLDTGLTGCILSDSFQRVNGFPLPGRILGACVSIHSINGEQIRLTSCDQHWRLSSFRLPWFYDDDDHPHIIAMGNTFWQNTKSLTIDPSIGRFKVEV